MTKNDISSATPSMFEKLMDLPLFSGVSRQKLAQIVGETKFHFLKYPAGEKLVNAGDICSHIAFVISGTLRYTASNDNGRFIISQDISAPAVISPDFLFGKYTRYPGDAVAADSVGILKIAKNEFTDILQSEQIVLFNYLNLICANAQKSVKGLLSLTTGDLDERIAYWIGALTQQGATNITLSCRRRDLYSLFGMQRSAFESTLSSMRDRGLIDYTTTDIIIKDRAALLNLLLHNPE